MDETASYSLVEENRRLHAEISRLTAENQQKQRLRCQICREEGHEARLCPRFLHLERVEQQFHEMRNDWTYYGGIGPDSGDEQSQGAAPEPEPKAGPRRNATSRSPRRPTAASATTTNSAEH